MPASWKTLRTTSMGPLYFLLVGSWVCCEWGPRANTKQTPCQGAPATANEHAGQHTQPHLEDDLDPVTGHHDRRREHTRQGAGNAEMVDGQLEHASPRPQPRAPRV